jgi:hypothetical protein
MIQLNPLVLPMFFPYVRVISPSFSHGKRARFPMSSLRWQEAETFGAKLSALGAALGATCGAEEFRESVKDRDAGGDRGWFMVLWWVYGGSIYYGKSP